MWPLDLTGKTTLDGKTRVVLGILEHASRTALWLEALESKIELDAWREIRLSDHRGRRTCGQDTGRAKRSAGR